MAGLWHFCYSMLRRARPLRVPQRLESIVSKCREQRVQAQSLQLIRDVVCGEEVEVGTAKKRRG